MTTKPERPIFRLERAASAGWNNIHKADEDTSKALLKLQRSLRAFSSPDTSVVVFGSLARREFTVASDVDWTLLIDGTADPEHWNTGLQIAKALEIGRFKGPGREGTFGDITFSHDLIHYIGGEDDTNTRTTRRLLPLLESSPIGRPESYDRVRRMIFQRYLSEDQGWLLGRNPKGVPRFLQNDVARYWRTIAVDFAYKQRGRGGQGWALRSAKLRLSRKLIYVAGLLTSFHLAMGGQRRQAPVLQTAIEKLDELTQLAPMDIVALVLLEYDLFAIGKRLFAAYDEFLGLLDDKKTRDHLAKLAPEATGTDATFESVRGLGHRFQAALDDLFFKPNGTDLDELIRIYGVF